ncbi:MAG: ATP-binding protein [Campylobacterales bacterium]
MTKQSRSLTALVSVFGLFLAVVPLLVYQSATLYSSAKTLEATHAKELQQQTALTANLINQAVAEKVAFLGGISDALAYLSAQPKSFLLSYLEGQKAKRNDLLGLAVGYPPHAGFVATAGFDAVLLDAKKPQALTRFLQACGETGEGSLLVSDAIALESAPHLFFCTRAPTLSKTEGPIALLAMDFHNIALLLSQFEAELEGDEPVALIDHLGNVVYATGTRLKQGDSYGLTPSLLSQAQESALFRNVTPDKAPVMTALESLSHFGHNGAVGWRLIAPLPESVIRAKLFDTLKLNIALGAAIVALALLAGFVLARNIARPLKTLVSMASRIREGAYDARITLSAPPKEIAVLGAALNEMAERIQTRTRQLQEQQSFGQFLLDASPVFMMTVRHERIEYVNRSFLNYLGFESLEGFLAEVTGFSSLIARIDDQAISAGDEAQIRAALLADTVPHVVYFRRGPGQNGQPFIAAAAHFLDHDRSVLTFADVTVIEKQREHLDKKVQQAEAARRAQQELMQMQARQAQMGEMIGAIAHQWKQPLTVLSLQVQELELMFADGELTREYLENYAAEADRMIEHMSQTVDDFRNFFRPAPAQLFSVRSAVERLRAMLAKLYEKQKINLKIEVAADGRIQGAISEFQQVLVNLINNARDALNESGAADRTVTVRIDAAGNEAVITVSDQGGGIPEAVLPRIFDSYFTTKSQEKGTGIGLFMSKQIIEEKMGGTLSAENTAEGAKFTIRVPLSQPA